MLTRNLATEWAKYNIQVNGIGPGYFETSQTAPIRVDGHPFNDFIIIELQLAVGVKQKISKVPLYSLHQKQVIL